MGGEDKCLCSRFSLLEARIIFRKESLLKGSLDFQKKIVLDFKIDYLSSHPPIGHFAMGFNSFTRAFMGLKWGHGQRPQG